MHRINVYTLIKKIPTLSIAFQILTYEFDIRRDN